MAAATPSNFLVDNDLLPLTSIFIEPAKVLFLNNAINHGVLTPLGIHRGRGEGQVGAVPARGQPRPGLGLLLAYTVFGKGLAKATAPGAAIIQFFGGIHEVYFPYVLMKPKLILATILGGMTGVFINVLFDSACGRRPRRARSSRSTRRPPAAASWASRCRCFGAAAVSFVVARCPAQDGHGDDEADLAAATAAMESMKGKKSRRLRSAAPARRTSGPIQIDRVRLRRGHGLLGDGRLGAAQEDPGGRASVTSRSSTRRSPT